MMGWRFDYNAHWPYVNLVPHHYLYSYGRMQEVWPIPSPLNIRGPSAIGLTVTAMRVSIVLSEDDERPTAEYTS